MDTSRGRHRYHRAKKDRARGFGSRRNEGALVAPAHGYGPSDELQQVRRDAAADALYDDTPRRSSR